MTLDEIVYHQENMVAKGCSAADVAAFAAAALAWRDRQRALRRERRSITAAVAAADIAETRMFVPPIDNAAIDGRINREPAESASRQYMRARLGLEQSRSLSAVEARVALAILSHFNHKSGRCDPGHETLAREANTSERTARRAIVKLRSLGLFEIRGHAGSHHQNAYRPNFEAMIALADAATVGRLKQVYPANRPKSAAQPATGGHQTFEENKIPTVVGGRRRARPDPAQRFMFLPIVNPRIVAAQAAAERRVMDDIERQGKRQPSFNVSGLTEAQWADVHAAEVNSQGAGIETIFRLLAERHETGPPSNAANGG